MNIKVKNFLKEWVIPFAIEIIIVLLLVKYVFFFVVVPTGSMIPTILEHSFLFATRVHNPEKDLERGDIVVFKSDELNKTLVKRLIGLPGETVDIDEKGHITIDGAELEESYVKNRSPVSGEFEVPEDCYFFLGDNRSGSLDARVWKEPYISEDKVEGKAVFTIWPVAKLGMLK
ncbi:MAG: signal peptidase I [Angelakisella sp.]